MTLIVGLCTRMGDSGMVEEARDSMWELFSPESLGEAPSTSADIGTDSTGISAWSCIHASSVGPPGPLAPTSPIGPPQPRAYRSHLNYQRAHRIQPEFRVGYNTECASHYTEGHQIAAERKPGAKRAQICSVGARGNRHAAHRRLFPRPHTAPSRLKQLQMTLVR